MTEEKSNKHTARRRLLKSVVAGGGVLATGKLLPENWARPVVESVLLPAHAQTSKEDPEEVVTGNFGPASSSTLGSNDRGRSILDFFVQPAHANGFGFSATVGQVTFDAFWTVRENEAEICGRAAWIFGISEKSLIGTRSRSGDKLKDFSQDIDGQTLKFVNQKVSGGGVSLTAEANGDSVSLFAGPGDGCGGEIKNLTSLHRSSSPYSEDDVA